MRYKNSSLKQPLACESTSNPLPWPLPWRWLSSPGTPVLRKMSRPLPAALRAALDFLATLSHTLQANHRLYLAIILMLVLAPLASVGYMLFDSKVVVPGWYYQSYYYLFYVLCPWLTVILFSTGLFLTFPAGTRRAWFTTVPVTTAISKILWLCTITSNEDFHHVVPTYFLLVALFLALLWLFLIDWLMSRQYHGIDALIARMDGLFMVNMNTRDKIRHLHTTWTDLKNFKHKF